MNGLRTAETLCLAKLTRIERTDGVFHYLTDHDRPIWFEDEDTGLREYTPGGSFDGSSRLKESGVEETDAELVGAITADQITNTDIRAGRFRGAWVIEYVVDWRFPFAGYFERMKYRIQDTEHDEEKWVFHIVGLAALLKQKLGSVFGRTCERKLGDARCGVNLIPHTSFGVEVVNVLEARRIFRVAIGGLVAYPAPFKNYLQFGEVRWTSGLNMGLVSEIKTDERDSGETSKVIIELFLPTPEDITPMFPGDGDFMEIVPGCNKLHIGDDGTSGHCVNKFSNGPQFKGFRFLPGRDRLMKSSSRK